MTLLQLQIIKAIKTRALERYNESYGYQVYAREYTDSEILEEFGQCATVYDALNDLTVWVSIKEKRYNDKLNNYFHY